MTRLERWLLRRLLAREVRQGAQHHLRIIGLYREVRLAAMHEFREDPVPSLNAFLREQFERAARLPLRVERGRLGLGEVRGEQGERP